MSEELLGRIQYFLDRFECVFDEDWDFTRDSIIESCSIGTFLHPKPYTFKDNGSNREGLLDSYRDLRAFMISEGLYTPEE